MTDKWISGGADAITIDWKSAGDDADESDRGTYFIGMKGVSRRIAVRSGWHSMEAAAQKSHQLRDMLITLGVAHVAAYFHEHGH